MFWKVKTQQQLPSIGDHHLRHQLEEAQGAQLQWRPPVEVGTIFLLKRLSGGFKMYLPKVMIHTRASMDPFFCLRATMSRPVCVAGRTMAFFSWGFQVSPGLRISKELSEQKSTALGRGGPFAESFFRRQIWTSRRPPGLEKGSNTPKLLAKWGAFQNQVP